MDLNTNGYISTHITEKSKGTSGSAWSRGSNGVTWDPTYSLCALSLAQWASSSVSTLCRSPSQATRDASLMVSKWLQQCQTSQLRTRLSTSKEGVSSSSSCTIWCSRIVCPWTNHFGQGDGWAALIELDVSIAFSFLIYNNIWVLVMFQVFFMGYYS